jgi:hypothetical protein
MKTTLFTPYPHQVNLRETYGDTPSAYARGLNNNAIKVFTRWVKQPFFDKKQRKSKGLLRGLQLTTYPKLSTQSSISKRVKDLISVKNQPGLKLIRSKQT